MMQSVFNFHACLRMMNDEVGNKLMLLVFFDNYCVRLQKLLV